MSFDEQMDGLIYFHLEGFVSARELLQSLEQNPFAKELIAPAKGIQKSAFFEALNTRGLDQMIEIDEQLYDKLASQLPDAYPKLGKLIAIDGTLIDAILFMEWADYRRNSHKAKAHVGFSINRGTPGKLYLSDEGPFVEKILQPGETGVMDRYYQCHRHFDLWQSQGKHFVCRIKENTTKTLIKSQPVKPESIVFYDAIVKLGSSQRNYTQNPIRVVGYEVN